MKVLTHAEKRRHVALSLVDELGLFERWAAVGRVQLAPHCSAGPAIRDGDRPFEPMNQGTHPEELPAEVLDDVASVVGAEVTLLSRLPGGVNGGAMRVQLAGRANAVLKAVPRAHPNHLDETLRAQRVVEHMRRRGYPTPAWLGVGATATHVWHLMDFVDAAPVPELTPSLVEQLMEIIELQAGQASEPYDHWSYAWRVATGQESAVAGLDFNETPEQSLLRQSMARLSGYSSVVSALVERLRLVCADVPPPREAPDMVHTDLNPSNVLVRDGAVVAVVDIGNAGSGTRATDLTDLVWYTFQDPLDGVRRRLWTRILDLVGWEGAAVLAATQILHMLEVPHPSRAPRCRSRGGQARPSRPRRAERASLTVVCRRCRAATNDTRVGQPGRQRASTRPAGDRAAAPTVP